MQKKITLMLAVAVLALAATVRSNAQTGAAAPSDQRRTMVVAMSNESYLVTDNSGATWRLVDAAEAAQLNAPIVRMLKSAGSPATPSAATVSPNPASGPVSFQFTAGGPGRYSIELVDARGASVMTTSRDLASSGTVSETVDLSSLSSGVYYYRITNGEGPVVGSGAVTVNR